MKPAVILIAIVLITFALLAVGCMPYLPMH